MQERHFFNLNTRLDEKSDVMINEQILAEEVFEKFIMIETTRFFTNYFLVAMPILTDAYFNRLVFYICELCEKGEIVIIINQPLQSLMVNI